MGWDLNRFIGWDGIEGNQGDEGAGTDLDTELDQITDGEGLGRNALNSLPVGVFRIIQDLRLLVEADTAWESR